MHSHKGGLNIDLMTKPDLWEYMKLHLKLHLKKIMSEIYAKSWNSH